MIVMVEYIKTNKNSHKKSKNYYNSKEEEKKMNRNKNGFWYGTSKSNKIRHFHLKGKQNAIHSLTST